MTKVIQRPDKKFFVYWLSVIFLVFTVLGCVQRDIPQERSIRILSLNFFLDGGSISVSYLDKDNKAVSIVIAEVFMKSNQSPTYNAARLGSVFFDGHPDAEGSRLANEKDTAKVLSDLESWYQKNISDYGIPFDVDFNQYRDDFLEKYTNASIQRTSYFYILEEAPRVRDAIKLIRKGLALRAKYKEEEILEYRKLQWPHKFDH